MLTADECRAKAKTVYEQAKEAREPKLRAALTRLSRHWEHMAAQAEWQDAHPMSVTYRSR
jgi:hypothetical protein